MNTELPPTNSMTLSQLEVEERELRNKVYSGEITPPEANRLRKIQATIREIMLTLR